MKISDLLAQVLAIAAKEPTYREGGTGTDGTCDCVGLIMGAAYKLGHKRYPLHSSNYFARYEVEKLHGASNLQVGELVFKGRYSSTLNERYLQGGVYFNGDLTDYYHIGIVLSVDPLDIIHCTSGGGMNGIAHDNTIRNWSAAGKMADVDYEEEEYVKQEAIVTAPSGSTVFMRKSPSKASDRLAKVPIGATVEVLTRAGEWATIEWLGVHGYMMTQFLKMKDEEEQPEDPEGITLLESIEGMEDRLTVIEQMLTDILAILQGEEGVG